MFTAEYTEDLQLFVGATLVANCSCSRLKSLLRISVNLCTLRVFAVKKLIAGMFE